MRMKESRRCASANRNGVRQLEQRIDCSTVELDVRRAPGGVRISTVPPAGNDTPADTDRASPLRKRLDERRRPSIIASLTPSITPDW